MSVSGISSSLVDHVQTPPSPQSKRQQFEQTFQQLGQDLKSGNLSAATADLGSLQKLEPQSTTNSAAFDNSPIGKAFSQLTQDIHSGNLSGARQDYSKIEQDIQSHLAHWHHGHGGPIAGGLLQSQSFSPTSVQQAYSSVQAPVLVSSQPTSSGVSVKA